MLDLHYNDGLFRFSHFNSLPKKAFYRIRPVRVILKFKHSFRSSPLLLIRSLCPNFSSELWVPSTSSASSAHFFGFLSAFSWIFQLFIFRAEQSWSFRSSVQASARGGTLARAFFDLAFGVFPAADAIDIWARDPPEISSLGVCNFALLRGKLYLAGNYYFEVKPCSGSIEFLDFEWIPYSIYSPAAGSSSSPASGIV